MKKFIRDFLLLTQPRDKITMVLPRTITKRRKYRNTSCSVLQHYLQLISQFQSQLVSFINLQDLRKHKKHEAKFTIMVFRRKYFRILKLNSQRMISDNIWQQFWDFLTCKNMVPRSLDLILRYLRYWNSLTMMNTAPTCLKCEPDPGHHWSHWSHWSCFSSQQCFIWFN